LSGLLYEQVKIALFRLKFSSFVILYITKGNGKGKAMIRIELNSQEADILHLILESYLSDLRMEIANTDSMDFRESLKERKVFIKKLLQELEVRKAA